MTAQHLVPLGKFKSVELIDETNGGHGRAYIKKHDVKVELTLTEGSSLHIHIIENNT